MWLTRCSILDMELRAASVTSDEFLSALVAAIDIADPPKGD